MSAAELSCLLPLIVIGATVAVVMLLTAFYRCHISPGLVTVVGLAVAFARVVLAWPTGGVQVTPLLFIDHYALFYMGLLFVAAGIVVALAERYLAVRERLHEEFYILLLLATLGSAVLVASSHFASFFLGLEILSVSLYALVAYTSKSDKGLEAGLKYLVLAAISAAFLLFGMALVYTELGSMDFARVAAAGASPDYVLVLGLGLIVVGVGFKLALVPFQMWTPDVYEGAPAPVTAFVATVSKGGMFGLLLRFFTLAGVKPGTSLFVVFAVLAVASMVVGNLLGLLQSNVKRLMAYSSIAHLGYFTVAFLAGGALGIAAGTFYLVAYVFSTLAVFGVLILVSPADRDADAIEDYRGLFWRCPWLAAVMTVGLLSLAGIPLTAGFFGKFYVVTSSVGAGLWWLALTLVASSVVGLFYYLRVLWPMYAPASEVKLALGAVFPVAGSSAAALSALAIVWLGVYPTPLVDLIQSAIRDMPR